MKLQTPVIQEQVQQAVDVVLILTQTSVIPGGFASILRCTLSNPHVPVWTPQIAWTILTPVIQLQYQRLVHVALMDMFPVTPEESVST